MLRRPRPGEDEEDILKMQEEYLREKDKNKKLKPAAHVVDIRNQSSTCASAGSKRFVNSEHRKPSKYAQAKKLANHTEKRPRNDSPQCFVGNVIEKNCSEQQESDQDDNVYFPKAISLVMGNIIEKNIIPPKLELSEPILQRMPSKGFPAVKKRDPKIFSEGESIFSQMMDMEKTQISSYILKDTKSEEKSMELDAENSEVRFKLAQSLNLPAKSYIVTSDDADSIHNQNIEILGKMTEKEILEEQQKILSNLDPQLIELLKSKRARGRDMKMDSEDMNKKEPTALTKVISQEDTPRDNVSILTDTLWDNDVISHPNVDKWIHFHSLEKDKMEWMKGIEESKKEKGDAPYEARFDFKGYLLPYTVEYTEETKTLFHHGEESHRPGYCLLELFELCRSSVIQQRIMALNIIGGVLEYYSTGIYKDVIDIPITKIFFVVRFAIDENKLSVLEPALRAMRNLLYSRIDEACLDTLLGLEEGMQQPCLEHDKAEIVELESKESELKDFHLADIDLITGALRTDMLQRLQYILDVIEPTFNCVQYSVQIITRLVRDSVELALKIANSDHLMTCIVQNFVPVTGINFAFHADIAYNGKPILAAVKLIRVLSLQSAELAHTILTKYNILEPICSYVSSGVDGTYGLRIQIEALAVLSNLLNFEVGTEKIASLAPILTMSLYKHINGTDIDINSSVITATHAAILIQLVSQLLDRQGSHSDEIKQQIYPLIKQGLTKWMSQLGTLELYSFGHLKLLCAILDCVKVIIYTEGPRSVADGGLQSILKLFAGSKGFETILKQLLACSNLLSGIENKQIHSLKNLINLGGSIVAKQKVLPVISFASPLPFLLSLVKVLDCLKDENIIKLFVVRLQFYLTEIKTSLPSLCNNWFTRIETDFLFHVLKVAIKLDFEESEKDLLYAVANKMCYILRADKKREVNFLFENIIFNKHWFTAQRLLNLVSLNDSNLFTKTLTAIDQIRHCYTQIINVSFKDASSSITLRNWQEPILPRDWIYLPIVKLYSENQEVQNLPEIHGLHARKVAAIKAAEKLVILGCCLEWILFNELCFENLLKDIDTTDRFCRLLCVFLCDNSLFLDTHIKALLSECIHTIFEQQKSSSFNFDKELTGVHNFQDFYTQILEQFQAVSYGDHNFAACVLVPLAQRHNMKWRKLIWSEYAGCLRALDCPENKLCYDLSDYLYPEETDESLVKSYLQALSSNLLRPNTIAHTIAAHHVNSFKRKNCS